MVGVVGSSPIAPTNLKLLFGNLPQWQYRVIPFLFLESDYVQTVTELAFRPSVRHIVHYQCQLRFLHPGSQMLA